MQILQKQKQCSLIASDGLLIEKHNKYAQNNRKQALPLRMLWK